MSSEIAVRQNAGEIILNGPRMAEPLDIPLVLAVFGLKDNDPQVHAMLAICRRYGLDPILKHVQLLNFSGKPTIYITRDGLLHVAHNHPAFDGIQAKVTGETDTHLIATCQVWRKDMSHVFEYQGRYPKNGANLKFAPEMAIKVSECMTLRRAFNIAVPTVEERWDTEEIATTRPTPGVRQVASKEIEAPPVVDFDPELRAAMLEFGAKANAMGYDVMNPATGRQLHKKRVVVLKGITNRGYSDEELDDPQTWIDAITCIYPQSPDEDDSEPLPNINHADAPRCSVEGCANVLTTGQAQNSMDKFGVVLCFRHQEDAKSRAQIAKETPQPTLTEAGIDAANADDTDPFEYDDTQENRTKLINDFGAMAATCKVLDTKLPAKNQKAILLQIIADINGVTGYSIADNQFPTVREIQKAIAGLPKYAKQKAG